MPHADITTLIKNNDPFECDTYEEIEQTKYEDKLENGKLSNDGYECDTDS